MRHQLLEHDLVHAQRRGEHASADVGDVEAFEQSLDGAVLAERPVQHGEHDVGAVESSSRLERYGLAPLAPDAVAADLDPPHLVAGTRQSVSDRRCGCQRDLVLGRAPAAEDGDREAASRLRGSSTTWSSFDDVVEVVGVVVVVGGWNWPTTIVTVLPFVTLESGIRVLRDHDPVLRACR